MILMNLLAGPEEIRYWLIVLMIWMMRISPMILMNLIILMILMILSKLLGPLVKTVKSGLGPDFRGTGKFVFSSVAVQHSSTLYLN